MIPENEEKIKTMCHNLQSILQTDYDYKTGKVFSSMCTTPHPLLQKIFAGNLHRNLGDPGLFFGTYQLEQIVI